MRNALDGFEGSIAVGGRKVTNLRYADDIVLIAGSLEELQNPVKRVKLESEKAGLFLNFFKLATIIAATLIKANYIK